MTDQNRQTARDGPQEGSQRPWQFSLRELLFLCGSVCILVAAAQWFGWLAACIAVVVVWVLAKTSRENLVTTLVSLAVGLFLVTLLMLPTCVEPRVFSRVAQCRGRVGHIAKALFAYEHEYGSLPPAYVADDEGRPMYSWRVLILPYIEENSLFERIDRRRPWDDPANRASLAEETPRELRCPCVNPAFKETSYVAVVGPGTCWPGPSGLWSGEIHDDWSQTILLVEVCGSGIHWMEPRDLTVEEVIAAWKSKSGGGISSLHPGGPHVCLADGTVRQLPPDIDAATLRALLTVDGGEEIVE